jgi:hypothetical protein
MCIQASHQLLLVRRKVWRIHTLFHACVHEWMHDATSGFSCMHNTLHTWIHDVHILVFMVCMNARRTHFGFSYMYTWTYDINTWHTYTLVFTHAYMNTWIHDTHIGLFSRMCTLTHAWMHDVHIGFSFTIEYMNTLPSWHMSLVSLCMHVWKRLNKSPCRPSKSRTYE